MMKQWSNRRKSTPKQSYQTWTARITWTDDGEFVRIKMETPDGIERKSYRLPDEEVLANETWDKFKAKWRLPI